jgi:hypothetical protein
MTSMGMLFSSSVLALRKSLPEGSITNQSKSISSTEIAHITVSIVLWTIIDVVILVEWQTTYDTAKSTALTNPTLGRIRPQVVGNLLRQHIRLRQALGILQALVLDPGTRPGSAYPCLNRFLTRPMLAEASDINHAQSDRLRG